MSSQTFDLTDAVVDALNAHEFALEFEAARIERPIKDLPELDVLTVSVMPGTRKRSIATRGARSVLYRIDVAVQKKFAPGGGDPEIDPLMELAEEIGDYFLGARLTDPSAICKEVDHPYLFFPDHWEKRLFTSTIAFNFQIGP